MKIFDGQMIYNRNTRYNITPQVLRTKIMPRGPVAEIIETENGKIAVDENGEIIDVETKPNWVPLALAAGAAYFFLV